MLATTLDGIDFLPALHALSMVVERLQTERQDEPYNNLYRFDSKQGAARQLNSNMHLYNAVKPVEVLLKHKRGHAMR